MCSYSRKLNTHDFLATAPNTCGVLWPTSRSSWNSPLKIKSARIQHSWLKQCATLKSHLLAGKKGCISNRTWFSIFLQVNSTWFSTATTNNHTNVSGKTCSRPANPRWEHMNLPSKYSALVAPQKCQGWNAQVSTCGMCIRWPSLWNLMYRIELHSKKEFAKFR